MFSSLFKKKKQNKKKTSNSCLYFIFHSSLFFQANLLNKFVSIVVYKIHFSLTPTYTPIWLLPTPPLPNCPCQSLYYLSPRGPWRGSVKSVGPQRAITVLRPGYIFCGAATSFVEASTKWKCGTSCLKAGKRAFPFFLLPLSRQVRVFFQFPT